jgi:hypothetical protein
VAIENRHSRIAGENSESAEIPSRHSIPDKMSGANKKIA